PIVPVLVGGSAVDHLVRVDEELDLHLLELARPEDEVARRDLVAKGLADLGDTERELAPRRLQHVVEVHEDALGRLRSQVGDGRVLFHRAHERLEHEIEVAGLGELPLATLRAKRAPGAAVPAGLAGGDHELVPLGRLAVVYPRQLVHLVGPEAALALAAVDHGIAEVVDVAAGLPHGRVHEDRCVEPHHVAALLHEVPPPHAPDVVPQLDAEGAVVPARAGATVDLARLEDEAAALAEGHDDVHRNHRLASSATVALTALGVLMRALLTWAPADAARGGSDRCAWAGR